VSLGFPNKRKREVNMKLTATKPEKEKEQGMKPYHHQATAKVVYDLLIG
jgi:hypothetical protein